MRRWIAMLLALGLLGAMAACSGEEPAAPSGDTEAVVEEPAGPEAPEEPEEPSEQPSEPSEAPGEELPEEPAPSAEPAAALTVTAHPAMRYDEQGNLLLQENLMEASVALEEPASASAINDALAAWYAARQEQAAQCLEQARKDQAYNAQAGIPFYGYAVTDQIDAGRMDGAVISVVRTTVDNTGGVHGITAVEARNFDAADGRQLTLSDVAADQAALSSAVADAVTAAVAADPEAYYPNAGDQAGQLLREGSWYFSRDGLTVLADPYLMAPYAAGVLRFTVPYAELTGILADDWMPGPAAEAGGTPEAALAESGVPDAVAAVTADEGGSPIAVTTDGPLRDVRVRRVSSTDGETWYAGALCLYLNRLLPGETVSVAAMLPDVMTNLMLTCETDGGTACYGFFQSGKDGSVFLLPLERVVF